jgi:glycerol kinase
MFRKREKPPSSGTKCKLCTHTKKKQAEIDGKLAEVVTTNIPVNRKYAVVGSVTTRGEYREVLFSGERNSSRGI